jgi:hypothetical protein
MWNTVAEIYIFLGGSNHITKSTALYMSTQTYFLKTFPLLYQRVLICSSFIKHYLPATADDAVAATATVTANVSALVLQTDSSFAPTETAETEIRTDLEV